MAAPPSNPEPGAVQVENGLILSGMCSTTNTFFDGDGVLDLGIELRLIDQGFRKVYVSTRTSQPAVPNPAAWPVQIFSVPQKRTANARLPQAVGPLSFGPFGSDGTAIVGVATADNRIEEIQVGIVQINELYAEVIGLTHNWRFSVSTASLPAGIMYPGFLSRVPKFDIDHFVRLEIARMLIRAGRLDDAASTLASIKADFPDAADQLPAIAGDLRSERGRQLLQIFEQRRSAGQYRLALNAGLLFPQVQIAPDVQLQARELVSAAEQNEKRCKTIRFRLSELAGQIEMHELKSRAMSIVPQVQAAVNADTLDRFSAFELLADTDDMKPEASLALAISGWLLGAENAIQNLEETFGLFEARILLSDYLQTTIDQATLRSELTSRIAEQEGVSAARMADVIRHLPALDPPRLKIEMDSETRRESVPASNRSVGYCLQLPPEFNPHRPYPLLVAFPREGIPAAGTVAFWSGQADQNGYIVVSPEIYSTSSGSYDASATQHSQFLELMRRLKLSLNIQDDRVFAVGHGIGGEAAIDMATSHPELFAGVVSLAGLGRRHFQWTAYNDPNLAWYLVVGDAQGGWFERLRFLLASKLFRRDSTTRRIANAVFVLYPNRGFESYFEELHSVFQWMALHRRVTFPEKIDAAILRSTDTSWSWLELADVPQQFTELDSASNWNDSNFRSGAVSAELTRSNGIIITRSPSSNVTIKLAPGMPGINLDKPVTLRSGRERTTVSYDPKLTDMLEELYNTGERQRLCFMRVSLLDR